MGSGVFGGLSPTRGRAGHLLGLTVASFGLVIGGACQDSTQVTVSLRTNVQHDARATLAIWAGTTNVGAPAVVWRGDWQGEVADLGSLVVTPRVRPDEPLALRVVLAVGREPTGCVPGAPAAGCIVARRKLSFVPRTGLRVPVVLHLQCDGVLCDEESTCNALGRCVPATVSAPSCSGPNGCALPDDEPGPIQARLDASLAPEDASGAPADVSAPVGDAGAPDVTPDAPPPPDACAPGVPMAAYARGVAFCGDPGAVPAYSVCTGAALCNADAGWSSRQFAPSSGVAHVVPDRRKWRGSALGA